ncbi:MAG TPA: SAM-dependent methyltransferase [Streptosporangiaceae bacterium]
MTGGLEGATAGGLLTPAGRDLLDRLAGQDITPDRALVLSTELRREYPASLVAAALTQQALRMSGRAKFSCADRMLFTRAGLEQASSELAAAHSAARLASFATVADLCCGIGGNLAALAGGTGRSGGRRLLAIDRDLTSLIFARHNVLVSPAAAEVTPVCADVTEFVAAVPARRVDAVFIDPARRSGDRRLRTGDSEPALDWCLSLAGWAPAVCVKAAPGLPRELIPAGWEAEFLAIGRGLKEALLWSPALATATRRATVLPGGGTSAPGPVARAGHTLTPEPGPPVPVRAPGEFLLDPNPAVTRAGLVEDLARRTGAWKIDPMIAFLAADREVITPFARTLRVLESMPWNEKKAARRLRELGIGSADIRRRGLAGDVELIRRRLGLRGEGSAVIALTRRENRPWGLICVPAGGQPGEPE